jgi:hypothetical protein
MTQALQAPSATADPVELADYLEVLTLQADDGSVSITDLLQAITVAGGTEIVDVDPMAEDGLVDPDEEEVLIDPGGAVLENLSASALAEIEAREVACGGAYPFATDGDGVLRVLDNPHQSPYVFMLLLTRFGGRPKKGNAYVSKIHGAQVFEALATTAAWEYFGAHDDHTLVYPFGFPRSMSPAGFKDALQELCSQVNEGLGCDLDAANLADQQDGGLDVVVVRRFPDRRPGQVLGFGQCATGADWRNKLSDLNPEAFCHLWMIKPPAVTPVKMFFVPHTIEERRWLHTLKFAGVVFDRCRTAYYCTLPDDEALCQEITDWTSAVVEQKVQT